MILSNLKLVLGDERAVSPIIGSILMVGVMMLFVSMIISPALMPVIQEAEPNAKFDISFTGGKATITYWSGEPLQYDQVKILVNGEQINSPFLDTIRPGHSEKINVVEGDIIRIIWVSSDGTRSSTLAEETMGSTDESPTTPTVTPTPTPSATPTVTPTPAPTNPVASLEISQDGGSERYMFDASDSAPAEDIESYHWDYNNNGTIDETTEDPTTTINCGVGSPPSYCDSSNQGRVVVETSEESTDEATADFP